MRFLFFLLLFVCNTLCADRIFHYKYYDFNHSQKYFTITHDVSLSISIDSPYIDGFGYILNDEFYNISEEDITKALEFKEGDKVVFAINKNGKYSIQHYIPGHDLYMLNSGDSKIKFTIKSTPVPSGQPLPSVFITLILGSIIILSIKSYKSNSI